MSSGPLAAAAGDDGRSPGAAQAATAVTISVRASRETGRLPVRRFAISSLSLCRQFLASPARRRSHIRVVRAAAALGDDPVNVLQRVLDVTSLAVNAILRVDLQ